jgi:hypothetical protein
MTVVGDDLYWLTKPGYFFVLQRTSLETGETVELGQPKPPATEVLRAAHRMVSDGKSLFISDATCCAGGNNPILAMDLKTLAWRSAYAGIAQNPGPVVIASDVLHIGLGGYFLGWWNTGDLSAVRPPSNAYEGLWMMGSDGTRLFAQMRLMPAGSKIVEIDPSGSMRELGKVGKDIYAGDMELPVDDAFVYFAYDTAIAKASKDTPGAPTVVLDDAPNHPHFIQVDGPAVYFLDELHLYENKKVLADVVEPHALAQNANWLVYEDKSGISKIHK